MISWLGDCFSCVGNISMRVMLCLAYISSGFSNDSFRSIISRAVVIFWLNSRFVSSHFHFSSLGIYFMRNSVRKASIISRLYVSIGRSVARLLVFGVRGADYSFRSVVWHRKLLGGLL